MKKLIFFYLILFSLSVSAQDTAANGLLKDVHFTIDTTEGSPLTVRFADGRVAALQGDIGEPIAINYELQMNEMTCADKTYRTNELPKSCFLNLQVYNEEYKLIWLKNPDQSKIGKELVNKSNKSKVFDRNNLYSNFDIDFRPEKTINSKRPILTCQKFLFANFAPTVSDELLVQQFITDLPAYNQELKVAENKSTIFAEDIALKFLSKNEAAFANLWKNQNKMFITALFFARESDLVMEIIFPNNINNSCQLSIKSKIDEDEITRISKLYSMFKSNKLAVNGKQLLTFFEDFGRDQRLQMLKNLKSRQYPDWLFTAIQLDLVNFYFTTVGGVSKPTFTSIEVE